MGIKVLYDATARDFVVEGGEVRGVVVDCDGKEERIRAKAIVAASGGFEANIPWLKEYWGDVADNFIIRGAKYNDGLVLKALLNFGAKAIGDPKGFHAVACDARAPKFDGGIITRIDSIPFGVVLNKECKRFYDEGEDFWPKRYAIWGGIIANQPDQEAYAVFDSKAFGHFIPSVFPAIRTDTLPELAAAFKLDTAKFMATVEEFNRAVNPNGTFTLGTLDDCSTSGIQPPKSHWARAIDRPPFYGYPLRPGITFTYLGVGVNENAEILAPSGEPIPHLFAAGEVMAGNILTRGYLAGVGLTIGSVFGRIAGASAGRHAVGAKTQVAAGV